MFKKKGSLLGSFLLAKFDNILKFAGVLWSWLAALAMYTVHCTAKETCLAFVFSWSSDHLRLSVHFITSDWLWPSYLSGTIWDQLSPSGTISLRLGPSHSMIEHLRPLRQSLSFEGSNRRDFLWFHIHVTIVIQLVCHIHIGCKSSLLSYYHIHIHILFRFRFKFRFMFMFKFIFTQANLMFSIQSPVRSPE